jgi:DNA anti-recombination protein RmuC
MALDSVLKQLEAKIEELVAAYGEATAREQELAAKLEQAESRLTDDAEAKERITALEKQRDELTTRLEKVLERIDSTLERKG